MRAKSSKQRCPALCIFFNFPLLAIGKSLIFGSTQTHQNLRGNIGTVFIVPFNVLADQQVPKIFEIIVPQAAKVYAP